MSVSFRAAALAIAILFAVAAPVRAQVVPLEVYGALPALELVEPSPDGDRVALVTVAGVAQALRTADCGLRESHRNSSSWKARTTGYPARTPDVRC